MVFNLTRALRSQVNRFILLTPMWRNVPVEYNVPGFPHEPPEDGKIVRKKAIGGNQGLCSHYAQGWSADQVNGISVIWCRRRSRRHEHLAWMPGADNGYSV